LGYLAPQLRNGRVPFPEGSLEGFHNGPRVILARPPRNGPRYLMRQWLRIL
jgi:hypothetical protein